MSVAPGDTAATVAEAAVAGPSPAGEPLEPVCLVRLGEGLFAVPGRYGKGVVKLDTTTPVPRSTPALLGIVHLHGAIVPVVDGATLLGLRAAPDPAPEILVLLLEIAGNPLALRIDEVVAFEPLDLRQLQHPLGQVCLLDVETLITSLRVELLPAQRRGAT